MKYQISKRFQKDLAKISDQKILAKVRKCIEAVGESRSLSEISDLEALKGFSGYIATVSEFSGMVKLCKFSR
jgi:hypothetical protein